MQPCTTCSSEPRPSSHALPQIEMDLGVERVTAWPELEGCDQLVNKVWGTDAFQFAPGVKCEDRRTGSTGRLRVWVSGRALSSCSYDRFCVLPLPT